MTTTKRTAKTAASNTTTIQTSAAAPEEFRHESLWIVATKTMRSGPWTLVTAANGEHNARMIFDALNSTDAHVALIPSLASGGFNAVRSVDEETDEEGDAAYRARAPKEIEVWDNRHRVR